MDRQLDEALKVLGIPAGSDRETVSNAFRRLARATHPDVSTDPDAAERFATVAAAYRLVTASSRPPAHSGPRVAHAPATPTADPTTDRPFLAASPFPPGLARDRPAIVAGPVIVGRARRIAGG